MNNNGVVYTPGNEPENIKKRLDTLFAKLDGAYPDKVIFSLHKDHKKWGETVTELYRLLGYDSGNDLLNAYGYTVAENKGGRPKGDPFAVVEELKRRHPEGLEIKKMDELYEANPDIAPQIKTLCKEISTKGDITFKNFLIKEGIIKSGSSGYCKKGDTTILVLGQVDIEELKKRYKEIPFSGTMEELKDQNADLNWKAIDKYCVSQGMRTRQLLGDLGVFEDMKSKDQAYIAEIEKNLIEKYRNALSLPRTLADIERENPAISSARLQRITMSIYGESATDYLKRIGVIIDEKTQMQKYLDHVIPILKERYREKSSKPLSIMQMVNENKDLQIKDISKWIKRVFGITPSEFLISENILPNEAERIEIEMERRKRAQEELDRKIKAEVEEEIRQLENITFKETVKYKNSDKFCTQDEIKAVIFPYVAVWCRYRKKCHGVMSDHYQLLYAPSSYDKPDAAESAANLLDRASLSAFLESLIATTGKNYRPFTLCWARFATGESVARIISLLGSRKRGNAKDKYWFENLVNSLYYSDTKESFEYVDKIGNSQTYARIRGVTVQEWRDLQLVTDFGFDNRGERLIKCGEESVILKLNSTFDVDILDAQTRKNIRSISKKTEAGVQLAEETQKVRREVCEFYKKRKEYIRNIYITGEAITAKIWDTTYMKNPVFSLLIESVIWQDENKDLFEVKSGKILDIEGNDFNPCGNISIAHVLDMTEDEILDWQNHVASIGKSLIVEQVWEPIAVEGTKSISSDRYDGTEWTSSERNEFKRVMKSKGIEVRSEAQEGEFDHRRYTYVFDPNGTMLIGNIARMKYVVDEQTKTLTLGSISMYGGSDRERNAVIYELDKRSVKAAIKNDRASTLTTETLDTFTMAQISDFIAFSTVCNSNNCTAVLLEYKNSKYGAYEDSFDMFVLD